jgi:predicted O-methyltransferase YrrM
MNDQAIYGIPSVMRAIRADTERMGFTMESEPQTGSLLRTLAASKRGGRLLELGTGTGVGTAWLLAGMDEGSRLDTVESDPEVLGIARRHLGRDPRVTFHLADAAMFLSHPSRAEVDLIYADTWAGKFTHLDLALSLVRVGGLYVVDDLLPQPSWPDGHGAKVPGLIADLERRPDFVSTKLGWASGLMILVRSKAAEPGLALGERASE